MAIGLHGSNEIVAQCVLLGVDSETALDILSGFTVHRRTKRIGARRGRFYLGIKTFPP